MLKDGFTSPADLVHEINNLIESQKYEDAYKLVLGHLPDSRFQSSDVYYVCSRLCLSIADTHSRSNREQYEFYINSGYRFAKTGYSLDENHPGCAKYLAILLEKQLWIKGKRKWIEASITLREHLLKSLSLEPTDSLVLHKMGLWCFEVASWTWIEKKVAYATFKEAPQSSYNEALKYFVAAEERNHKSSSLNLLYIARSYFQLKQYDMARNYLEKCINHKGEDGNVEQVRLEATKLLEGLREFST